jgi:hypothetical protein
VPFQSEKQRRFLWAKHPEIAEAWAHGRSSVTGKKEKKIGKMPKFHSRSVHGSGEFSEHDIEEGYRCEPEMGTSGEGYLYGKKITFEGLKGD